MLGSILSTLRTHLILITALQTGNWGILRLSNLVWIIQLTNRLGFKPKPSFSRIDACRPHLPLACASHTQTHLFNHTTCLHPAYTGVCDVFSRQPYFEPVSSLGPSWLNLGKTLKRCAANDFGDLGPMPWFQKWCQPVRSLLPRVGRRPQRLKPCLCQCHEEGETTSTRSKWAGGVNQSSSENVTMKPPGQSQGSYSKWAFSPKLRSLKAFSLYHIIRDDMISVIW